MTENKVSDEMIREWAKKYYPEYADNIQLMRILYERKFGRGKVVEGRKFVEKKIKDLKEGEYVRIKGLVVSIEREYKYKGCPRCYKKKCEHNEEKVNILRESYLVGDDTGLILVVTPFKIDDGKKVLDIDDEVILEGKVKKFRDRLELEISKYEIVRKFESKEIDEKEQKVIEVIGELKKIGEMEKNAFERYIQRRYGLGWNDFKDKVNVVRRGDKEWVVFDKVVIDDNEAGGQD